VEYVGEMNIYAWNLIRTFTVTGWRCENTSFQDNEVFKHATNRVACRTEIVDTNTWFASIRMRIRTDRPPPGISLVLVTEQSRRRAM